MTRKASGHTQSHGSSMGRNMGHSTVGHGMLGQMDSLDEELNVMVNTGHSRWMIPYADLVTLLLGLFMVLFAMTQVKHPVVAAAQPEKPAVTMTKKPELAAKPVESRKDEEIYAMLAADLPVDVRNNMTLRKSDEGMVISLHDSVLFTPGSAELGDAAQQTLDQLAETLKSAHHPIRVEGHTDNTPIATSQYPSNWELSTARATAIVRYLSAHAGIAPSQLSAVGYGEFHPVANNSSIEGKQKNRRVDIVILGGISPSGSAVH